MWLLVLVKYRYIIIRVVFVLALEDYLYVYVCGY